MAGIAGARVETEQRYCSACEARTEWRRYRRGRRKSGETVYQWRCRACLDRKDRAAKERLKRDVQVHLGELSAGEVSGVAANDPELLAAWNTWVSATKRPDRDAPNSRFVEAYQQISDTYTSQEIVDCVAVAAYLPPMDRDPLDVRRLVDALSWEGVEQRARDARDGGAKVAMFRRPD